MCSSPITRFQQLPPQPPNTEPIAWSSPHAPMGIWGCHLDISDWEELEPPEKFRQLRWRPISLLPGLARKWLQFFLQSSATYRRRFEWHPCCSAFLWWARDLNSFQQGDRFKSIRKCFFFQITGTNNNSKSFTMAPWNCVFGRCGDSPLPQLCFYFKATGRVCKNVKINTKGLSGVTCLLMFYWLCYWL